MSEFIRGLREKIGNDLLQLPSAGAWVLDESRRVLLVRHIDGPWTIPGGCVEPFETPADTAVRETWEETGFYVQITGLVGVFAGPEYYIRYSTGDEVSFVATHFSARLISGTARPDPDGETVDLRFVTRDEAAALGLAPRHLREIDLALAGGGPHFVLPTWTPPA